MGWKDWKHLIRRRARHIYRRTVREKASPEFIAKGWAIGMFYGCLAPFGLQICLSIPTALWLRGSKTGAIFGTLITNPVTIVFLYPMQCYVGLHCMGSNHSYHAIEGALANVLQEQNWHALSGIGWELIAAFFLGGALLACIMTPLCYYGIRFLVIRHRDKLARKARDSVSGQEVRPAPEERGADKG